MVDGDTIKVEIEGTTYRVRYIGIDCPETVHPQKPVGWMGPEACEANRRLVEGETVYLEKDVSETDQYGRLLRYVFLADGTLVNAELVRQGYAQSATYPPDVRYQDLFLEIQNVPHLWGHNLTCPEMPHFFTGSQKLLQSALRFNPAPHEHNDLIGALQSNCTMRDS